MNQSEQLNELFGAMSKAQAAIKGALKDSKNPFFKSSYADLGSVWDACREPLAKNGLTVIQTTRYGAVGIDVITTLGHSSGQWISSELPIMALKNEPQAVGSAISYARRYALAAIVGCYQVDDDGERAMARPIITGSQPAPSDGHVPDATLDENYRVPFGKYNKRALHEIDVNDLASYVSFLEKKAADKSEALGGAMGDFVKRATTYIQNFERNAAAAMDQFNHDDLGMQ